MGTTSVYGRWTTEQIVQDELGSHCIAHARKGNVIYAAVQNPKNPDEVFGAVIVCGFSGGMTSMKTMGEDDGPYFVECPPRILHLLTPTTNENANQWRKACHKEAERRRLMPKLRDGDIIRFSAPISFTTGEVLDTFRVFKTDRKVRFGHRDSTIPSYRITNWQKRHFVRVLSLRD